MIESKYNTFWPRFWAGWIDALLFLPLYFINEWFFDQDFSGIANFMYWALVCSLSFYFYSVFMHGRCGQTLGKMVMKIKVFTVDGLKLGYKRAFYRDSVIIFIMIFLLVVEAPEVILGIDPFEVAQENPIYNAMLYVELIWFVAEFTTMLTNNKRRAIHDFIAGSVVQRI